MKAWEQEIIDNFGSFVVKVHPDSPIYEIIGKDMMCDGKHYWVLRNIDTGTLMTPCNCDDWIPLMQVEKFVEEFVPLEIQPTHRESHLTLKEPVSCGDKFWTYGTMRKFKKVEWEPIKPKIPDVCCMNCMKYQTSDCHFRSYIRDEDKQHCASGFEPKEGKV